MTALVLLKLLSDLGIYYAFGGFFAALAGAEAPLLLAAYGVQSAVGLLTYLLRERGWLRFLPLALLAVGWLLPGGSLAAWVAIAPPALYVIWLAAGTRYLPEQSRQLDIFSVFWKALLVFCLFLLMVGCGDLLAAITIPAGLIGLACCVLLNRSLRHDLAVCCQPRYQAMNLALTAGIGLAALGLSSRGFLHGCAAALRWVYETVFAPILMALFQLLGAAIQVVLWLFSWVQFRFTGEEQEVQSLTLGDTEDLFGDLEASGNNGELFSRVCIALALLLGAVLIVLMFRWLSRSARRAEGDPPARTVRSAVAGSSPRPLPRFARSPVQRVRLYYQKFLALYRSRGLERKAGDTSQDVAAKSRYTFDPAAVQALRQLYIAARYNDQATKEDAARARELYQSLSRVADQSHTD
ncbi:MAG: DUF4129 domain-containing protein [Clostridiales bacterium]|nr:DUF4129 domain-containing protein [Clostridiales bacterium]